MKIVKNIILILLVSASASAQQQKPLPRSVIEDYAYNAYSEFRYGQNQAFAALMLIRLPNKGYSRTEIAVGMETLKTNASFREATFEVLFRHGRNEDYLFANLAGIGMLASNAKILTDYIIEKYTAAEENEEKAQQRSEAEIEQKAKVTAKMKYEELINAYIKGVTPVNSQQLILSELIPDFNLLGIEPYLNIEGIGVKTEFITDSLMMFLPKHFQNEGIYFHISADGELLSVDNKDQTVSLKTADYPFLKKWISIQGAYQLNYNQQKFNVGYIYPGLLLARRKCTGKDSYYFRLDKDQIELVSDSVTIRSAALKTFRKGTLTCPNNLIFKFDSKKVEGRLLQYTQAKNFKELKKITNTHSKTGSSLLKAGLTIATGVPLILTDTERNDNLLRFEISTNKDITAIYGGGNLLKAIENTPTHEDYQLHVFNPEKKDFVRVNIK